MKHALPFYYTSKKNVLNSSESILLVKISVGKAVKYTKISFLFKRSKAFVY